MSRQAYEVPEYVGNPLIEPMGPIPDEKTLMSRLTCRPSLPPKGIIDVPKQVRLHQLMSFRSLHIPMLEGTRLAMTADLLIRQGYVGRLPTSPETWAAIYGERAISNRPPPLAAACIGCSGAGKSTSSERFFSGIPQTVRHKKFPNMADGLTQVLYLKVDVPASGGATELAEALDRKLDDALGLYEYVRPRSRATALERLAGFVRRASAHFLGILVLDEIENLFKLQTLKARRLSSKSPERERLRVADDVAMKWVVNLCNASPFPILVCGTPEAMEIMARRLSAAERFTTGGFHLFMPSPNHEDRYARTILEEFCKYQWFEERISATGELGLLVHQLTAGIPRIRTALWFLAHRCAFERNARGLELKDFRQAADVFLRPVKPAVEAILSKAPDALSRYEDLLPETSMFWASLFRPG